MCTDTVIILIKQPTRLLLNPLPAVKRSVRFKIRHQTLMLLHQNSYIDLTHMPRSTRRLHMVHQLRAITLTITTVTGILTPILIPVVPIHRRAGEVQPVHTLRTVTTHTRVSVQAPIVFVTEPPSVIEN